jgi:hypothetical protein
MEKESAIITVKDHFSYNQEVLNEILQDIESFNRKWCFFEFYGSKQILIQEVNYKKVKIGEMIEINSPGWKFHGHRVVVDKKRSGMVECYIPNDIRTRLKISASSVKFISQEKKEKLDVKVGDLVLITEARFRPRYEEGDVFKVVWKGAKYVRVVPKTPKFEVTIRLYHVDVRPGDNTMEFADKSARKVYRESVYSMDIPITHLKSVRDYYGEEMGGLLGDLDGIGL